MPLIAALLLCYVGGIVSAFASSVGVPGATIPLAPSGNRLFGPGFDLGPRIVLADRVRVLGQLVGWQEAPLDLEQRWKPGEVEVAERAVGKSSTRRKATLDGSAPASGS